MLIILPEASCLQLSGIFKGMDPKRKSLYIFILLAIIATWFFAGYLSNLDTNKDWLNNLLAKENIQGLSAISAALFSVIKLIPGFIDRAESALSKVNTAVSLLNKAKDAALGIRKQGYSGTK